MFIHVHVKEQYAPGSGKTQKFASSKFDIGKKGQSLTIVGNKPAIHGSKAYDTTAMIRLTSEELQMIVEEAVRLGILKLNSAEKVKIAKARKHVEEAMKALADHPDD